jgi:hypothetical protein
MAILKRGRKIRHHKHKPEVVTGDFELHYEDVVNRNRYAMVALLASGLVLLAVFVPSVVYRSVADTDNISVEAEQGRVINPELVTKVEGDVTASDNSYIEFRLAPKE